MWWSIVTFYPTIDFQYRTDPKDPEVHAYLLNSFQIPSVTQILSESGLSGDFEKLRKIPKVKKAIEHKREIGDEVHRATQFLDEGCLDWASLDRQVVPYVVAYDYFKRRTGFRSVLCEFSLVVVRGDCSASDTEMVEAVGMTLDRFGTMPDGSLWLLDLKTPQKKEQYWGYQTAAYEFGLKLIPQYSNSEINRGVLWLTPHRKTKKWEVLPHTDPEDLPAFLAAWKTVYHKRRKLLKG